MADKYEILCEEWRLRALDFDFKERFNALGLIGYKDGDLPISYYGIDYEIKRPDCHIQLKSNPDLKIDPLIKLAIYHLFYFSKTSPINSNEFVSLYDIKPAAPYYNAFKQSVLVPFAKSFEGKLDSLKEIGLKLGFKPLPFSDAGFEAMAFSCVPIRFLFWDGDDEFPAQANILFDKKITDFTHEETIITMAEDGVKLLLNNL